MSPTSIAPKRDRAAERDRSQAARFARVALRLAGGNRQTAAARLRLQAGEGLTAAAELVDGGRFVAARTRVDGAHRRQRAAELVEAGSVQQPSFADTRPERTA